jgi:hypothetical protein
MAAIGVMHVRVHYSGVETIEKCVAPFKSCGNEQPHNNLPLPQPNVKMT